MTTESSDLSFLLNRRPICLNQVNFPFFLAPMVGISHVATRLVCRQYLPANAKTFWPTEMLSSFRLPKQNLNDHPMTQKRSDEDDLVPQILGNDEEAIYNSIKKLETWGIQGVDINMGCPVKKALKHNYGVSLMGDIEYAAKVVSYAVKATSKPISVKLRSGLKQDFGFLVEFVKALEGAGASWLIVHPRLSDQKRRGKVDWEVLAKLRDQIKIPLVGNGDLQTSHQSIEYFKDFGVDGVMIGRALLARPWMLWQIGRELGYDEPEACRGRSMPESPEEEAFEYFNSLEYLWENLLSYYKPLIAFKRFEFYVRHSHMWLDFGHSFYSKVLKIKSSQEYDQIPDLLNKLKKSNLCMVQHTDLRI